MRTIQHAQLFIILCHPYNHSVKMTKGSIIPILQMRDGGTEISNLLKVTYPELEVWLATRTRETKLLTMKLYSLSLFLIFPFYSILLMKLIKEGITLRTGPHPYIE